MPLPLIPLRCRAKVVKWSLLSGQRRVKDIHKYIYVLFFISDPAARSFAGRIVSAEVFAAAQQKLSAQKREPKPKPKKKKMGKRGKF